MTCWPSYCLPLAGPHPPTPTPTPRLPQGFNDQCLGTIAPHLRPASFSVGEAIYERGDRCDDMYFVLDGSVLVHAVRCTLTVGDETQAGSDSKSKAEGGGARRYGRDRVAGEHIVSRGDIFGEGGLFSSELGDWRQENATALSWVSAYALSATALHEIAAIYPEVTAAVRSPIHP